MWFQGVRLYLPAISAHPTWNMIENLLLLQAESPSCIWGRSLCSPDGERETSKQYCNLTTKMNLFYQDVTRDQSNHKLAKLEPGEVRTRNTETDPVLAEFF